MDIEFMTVNRTEPDWVILRDALAHERIQLEAGEPVSEEVQNLLAQLRSDPTVAAARANLDANLDAISLAWQQQIDEGPQ